MHRLMARFDRFTEEALYGPNGFYTRGNNARPDSGDFVTSPETSNLFGGCIAVYLDRIWQAMQRPNPFVVVEAGSGRGTLCRDIFLSEPECKAALRYALVERSTHERETAFTNVVSTCFAEVDELPITALKDLPAGPLTGVVLGNELLDNLPPRVLQRTAAGWSELYVIDGRPDWQTAPQEAQNMASTLAPGAPPGTCIPLQLKAAVWVRRALNLLDRGRILLFDYGLKNPADFVDRPIGEWLRAYRQHRRAGDPYTDAGSRDITCDVAFDQLPGSPQIFLQRDWLLSQELETMTEWAREKWYESAQAPDTSAMAARVVLDEASALTDPQGLGAFLVAEWHVGD